MVVRAREEVKELDREGGRVVMRGRAVDPKGQPLSGVYVMLGDWGNAPPLITGTDGLFQAERQAAGRLENGDRFGLVYAEHATLPLVMAGVWRESAASSDVRLRPALAVTGYVVDPRGRAVAGATLRMTGVETGASDAPIPLGRFLPPVATDTNGQFRVNGIADGLRYNFSAEKDGYRAGRAVIDCSGGRLNGESVEVTPARGDSSPTIRVIHASEIILQPVGRVAVDETGILRAEVNLNDPAERARLEDALASFDPEHKDERRPGAGDLPVIPSNRFPYAEFPFSLRWLRGEPAAGSPLSVDDVKGRVVVYHFGSAYLESSLKRQFPNEPGYLSQISRMFRSEGVSCIWILPSTDGSEDAARLALETCGDIPIAVDRDGSMWKALGVMGYGGNVVVNRDGTLSPPCPNPHLFKVLKGILRR
jgi:hypothetical protein